MFMLSMFSIFWLGCGGSGEMNVESDVVDHAEMVRRERLSRAKSDHGEYYAGRLAEFLEKLPEQKPGGIVFLGDSITEAFPLEEIFASKNVINQGISGDRILGVQDRLDVSVVPLKPRRIYLMIGINDINALPDAPVEKFGKEYAGLLEDLKITAPQAEVMVFSILPMGGELARRNHRVKMLNSIVKKLADAHGFEWCDLHPFMKDGKSELRDDFTFDGLHLNLKGYISWLRGFLTQEEMCEAMASLAPHWMEKHKRTHKVDAIDPPPEGKYPGSRGRNQLIIYTPAYQRKTTQTNQWGNEAVVKNGVVHKVGGNNSPIPENGFVVSGHWQAGIWVETMFAPGMPVEYDEKQVRIGKAIPADMPPELRIRYLLDEFFEALDGMDAKVADEHTRREVLDILGAIFQIIPCEHELEREAFDNLLERIGSL